MNKLEALIESISEERLAPYRLDTDHESCLTPYARYSWNTALGESLFPCLQALEITLRNSLHKAIASDEGSEDWFENVLDSQDVSSFEDIKERLTRHNIPITPSQIVANSDLGFWVRLLNARYENVLWPSLLREAFPHMPNSIRTRKNQSKRMNRARALRNRVFHYEPIWNDSFLEQKHGETKEAIGWMSPVALRAVESFDRFPEVLRSGSSFYELRLSVEFIIKESD